MRTLLLLLLLAVPALAETRDWLQVSPGHYMAPDGPGGWLQGIYIYPPTDARHKAPGVWHHVSLLRSPSFPRGLPLGAHGIGLTGILVTTNPASTGIYSVTCAFRRGGSTLDEPYTTQTCAVNTVGWTPSLGYFYVGPGSGARVPAFQPVVLNGEDCSFDFKYVLNNPAAGPPLYAGGPAQGIPLQAGVNAGVNFLVAEWYGLPDLFPWAP